ncbi:hypothetical protein [Robiginitalea sp. SC105]|uniref:hypothetical protein n=1 Tax=Robiginitalea sp. SC105 TaxID=2762332 RepID=UPI00163A06D7|nr:hypothetical protein [Robiginitalea sp. SC105]MBC2840440.1 hypothetical protein [Robiginitalea sp. SC105]
MDFKKLISELSRRNVFRAVVAYMAVAWVIVQIADTVFPAFGAPPVLMKGLIYLLGFGLIFWVIFSWLYDLTPKGFRRTEAIESDPEIREENSRKLNQVIALAVVCAVLVLAGASFWAGSRWADPGIDLQARVAVLPLDTPSDTDEAYFSEGMTDALIKELSQAGDLLVLSMASTRYLEAGIQPRLELFREELDDVDYFVYGTANQEDNRIEIAVAVSRDLEKDPIWEHDYTRDLAEVRALWAEVAADIREQIGPGEVVKNRAKWKDLRPVLPETYELYLKGKYYLNKSTEEDWKRGLLYLQEAIDRNPSDPHAFAGMAEGYITWGHSVNPPPDVLPKAEAAAKRAIQLDSTIAEGWAALSQYHTYHGWDWDLADYAFRKANELNPNLAMNHYHRAWYQALFGRMDQAISEHLLAQRIDPFSSLHTAWLGALYNSVGEYDKALEQVRMSSEMYDDNALSIMISGHTYIKMGQVERGLDSLRKAARINGGWKGLGLGPALIQAGHMDEGMEIARELESREQTPFFSLCLARIYHAAGDFERTFQWLESAKGHAFYPWTVRLHLNHPEFRADPRFDELIRELHLPPPAPLVYKGEPVKDQNLVF